MLLIAKTNDEVINFFFFSILRLNFLDLKKKKVPVISLNLMDRTAKCENIQDRSSKTAALHRRGEEKENPKKKNQKEGEERWPFFTLSATQNPPEEREREASLALSDPMATDLVEAPSPTSQSPSHYRFFYNCFNF